ncbi:DUF3782 domain-containing protein [Candidatus Bathyarchaeota archaeon]|nr:DUF3782 domain-containing protein [Candidatus Bathyarchaeota archaeon]
METSELKSRFFALLREDVEFRYAVAGLLGLEEILRRLDRHEAELIRLREDFNKMREDFNRKAEEDSKRFAAIETEIARLREDMNAGFKRHDEEFTKVWGEIAKLREDMIEGFRRHDEELAKLREDMMVGFKRYDEELAKLRADMMEGFNLLRRHIDALGARWGLLSERAFKEGLRSLIEREFGFRVERWVRWDSEGYVHGHPSDVDVDIAVHDEKIILVEVKSHVGRPDVSTFKRKAEFYERVEGKKPSRLIIVTPYADENALETAKQLQIEVYMGV